MKVLKDTCIQPRPYSDSEGECVVLLEDGDDADKIIDEYVNTPRGWYEERYSRPRRTTKHGDYEGDLIVFDTHRDYID